jgi:hypothetical protein
MPTSESTACGVCARPIAGTTDDVKVSVAPGEVWCFRCVLREKPHRCILVPLARPMSKAEQVAAKAATRRRMDEMMARSRRRAAGGAA